MIGLPKRIAALSVCALLVNTLACHDATAPPSPYVGVYALVSVGGTPVPAPWNGAKIMSSTITLGNDGSFMRSVADTVYGGGSAAFTTSVQRGRWRVSGSTPNDPTLAATLNVTLSDGTEESHLITKFGIGYSYSSGDWIYSRSAAH